MMFGDGRGCPADDRSGHLPLAQDYRDLRARLPGALHPGTRSVAERGGSGQDNVYKFDGVNDHAAFRDALRRSRL
jgi:hypothetical protein